jgi:ankyrin repeat protein
VKKMSFDEQQLRDLSLTETWLKAGVDPNHIFREPRDSFLSFAVTSGRLDVAALLISHGAKVNNPIGNALVGAARDSRHSDLAAISFLLANGADCNMRDEFGTCPLAASLHNDSGFDILLPLSNKENLSLALIDACRVKQTIGKIRSLLSRGADVNHKTECGQTPLGAVRVWKRGSISDVESIEKMKILLNAGVDPCCLLGDTGTPLFFCLLETLDPKPPLSVLIDHGVGFDIDLRDKLGWTLLSLACARRNVSLVKFLLENDADPNIANDKGITPLAVSMLVHDNAITGILIDNGADVFQLDDEFVRPRSLARAWDIVEHRRAHLRCTTLVALMCTGDGDENSPKKHKGSFESLSGLTILSFQTLLEEIQPLPLQ